MYFININLDCVVQVILFRKQCFQLCCKSFMVRKHYFFKIQTWQLPLFIPRYSWNIAKVGIKHQSINQQQTSSTLPININHDFVVQVILFRKHCFMVGKHWGFFNFVVKASWWENFKIHSRTTPPSSST